MATGQQQYTEKPYKVLAEAYDASAAPVQAGVCVCSTNPLGWVNRPHVHSARGMLEVRAGDWVVQDLWNNDWDVMAEDEFGARFGGGNLADVTPAKE